MAHTDNTHEQDARLKRVKRWLWVSVCCLCVLLVGGYWLVHEDAPDHREWAHRHYVDSGHYHHDVVRQLKKAKEYLDFRLRQNARREQPQRLAIVLAIDETALVDDAIYRRSLHSSHRSAPMTPVRAFYDYAKARDIAVFFVSARSNNRLAGTAAALRDAGYRHWDGLLMTPDAIVGVRNFKVQQRILIEQQGYRVIINIGTNPLDLSGAHADMLLLLPAAYALHF